MGAKLKTGTHKVPGKVTYLSFTHIRQVLITIMAMPTANRPANTLLNSSRLKMATTRVPVGVISGCSRIATPHKPPTLIVPDEAGATIPADGVLDYAAAVDIGPSEGDIIANRLRVTTTPSPTIAVSTLGLRVRYLCCTYVTSL